MKLFFVQCDGSGLFARAHEGWFLDAVPVTKERFSPENYWAATPEDAIEQHCTGLPFGRVRVVETLFKNVRVISIRLDATVLIVAESGIVRFKWHDYTHGELAQLTAVLRHVEGYLSDGGGVIGEMLKEKTA